MILNLHNLRFSYPITSEKVVIDIRQWSVEEAETIFMYGASGDGKSTLLNLISGILPVSQGSLSVIGQQLENMSDRQRDGFRANHIGYVFQQFNLIPYLDAISNVELARHFCNRRDKKSNRREEIKDLLLTLNLSASEWNKPAAHLSIGQQQRVAIARAFINKPKLLLADEPTSSLDEKNKDNFISLLTTLVKKQKTTLVFVSHDLSLSSNFDRVQALSDINKVDAK